VNGRELLAFAFFLVGAANEVFEEEEIAWAALNDGEEPIAKFEFAAHGIGLLGGYESSKGLVVRRRRRREHVREGRDSGVEGGDEGCVQR
jgi:hypothetical protein